MIKTYYLRFIVFFRIFRRFSIAGRFFITYICIRNRKKAAQLLSLKHKKMNTTKNKRNVFFAITSIILMATGGLLLYQTLNVYFYSLMPLPVITLTFLSLFIYVTGATLMGRCGRRNGYRFLNETNNSLEFAMHLVAAGLLLLGFNTGFFPAVWKNFFFSWPMLLFALGAINICKWRHFIWGIILTAIGVFFLFSKIEQIYPDILIYEQFFSTYWPVFIILLGILIIISILFHPKFNKNCLKYKNKCNEGNIPNNEENQDGKINYKFTFSGTEQVILDPIFKGGNIDITFGGMELDLRRTSLAEGDTYLYINVVFGGIELTIPDHWDIEIRQNRFAGGIEDSREKGFEKDRTRKLIVIAKCTFGGIDIK